MMGDLVRHCYTYAAQVDVVQVDITQAVVAEVALTLVAESGSLRARSSMLMSVVKRALLLHYRSTSRFLSAHLPSNSKPFERNQL